MNGSTNATSRVPRETKTPSNGKTCGLPPTRSIKRISPATISAVAAARATVLLAPPAPVGGWARKHLMATGLPWYKPFQTSPKAPMPTCVGLLVFFGGLVCKCQV